MTLSFLGQKHAQLPATILKVIPFNSIKPLLPVITSEGVNVLLVDHSCRECTLRDVHRCEILPFILVDIIHLTTVQENVLDPVIAAHHVDKAAVDDRGMLLSALVHWMEHLDLAFGVHILVHSR
jgi:hypothetical protein